MATTDPAVEAAQRAMPQSFRDDGYYPSRDSIVSAREALAPVRLEIERLRGIWNRDNEEHKSVRVVLDRLSALVYTSEELQ